MRKRESVKIMAIIPVILFLISCNPIVSDSKSDSSLIITSMTGFDMEENEVNFIQSDVLYEDPDTGETSISSDQGIATFTAELLNPAPIFDPSHYNSIMVTKYTVSYFRSDGKTTEGVDVPYSFSGSLSALVEIGSTAEVTFVVVREVAKMEPPLLSLREGRGDGVIQATAKIEFYGHDMTNHNVKAIGYLTVFFDNYVNE